MTKTFKALLSTASLLTLCFSAEVSAIPIEMTYSGEFLSNMAVVRVGAVQWQMLLALSASHRA